jgi:hypothetical protein
VTEKAQTTEPNIKDQLIETLKKDAAEAKTRAEQAVKELEDYKKRSKAQKEAHAAKTEKPTPPTEAPAPPVTPQIDLHDHNQGQEKETGHLMHRWQRFCTGPNCEGENPDFKDETQCDPDEGGCGMHLGSVEVAKSLSRCPSCGGHKVRRLKK